MPQSRCKDTEAQNQIVLFCHFVEDPKEQNYKNITYLTFIYMSLVFLSPHL